MISVILGTKAQLIKMAPVMKEMQVCGLEYRFIHTGQHQETMEEMYADFGVKKPDVILYEGPDIVSVRQIVIWFLRLIKKTIFERKKIFGDNRQGIVLIHGDTLSTLLGALMGRVSGNKVGHVESGLRSFNYFQPFPEEITRVLVFRLSNILFCPGSWAVKNVEKLKKAVVNTNLNTMIDTIHLSESKIITMQGSSITEPFSIVSLHRYENIFNKEQLIEIVELLEGISQKHKLLFVLHPPTLNQLRKFKLFERLDSNENINCVKRFQHSEFLSLLLRSEFVITDGGSLQEEANYLGVPCLLFRETTERQEGLGENVVLSAFDEEKIDTFLNGYQKLRGKKKGCNDSPSAIIVDAVKHYAIDQ